MGFNVFVTISVLYIVLSNFGYDFNVLSVFAKLIAIDSLFIGLGFLGWKTKYIIGGGLLRYYCFCLLCGFLFLFNLLTWWRFSEIAGFLIMLAAIPQVLLELYEFFDYFTPIFVIYREISVRFCEFVFYSLMAVFANYLAKTAKIAVTIEWKYMRAKMVGVEQTHIKYALCAILRGFIAAKIGVPAWIPPRIVKSVSYAIVEAIFGSGEQRDGLVPTTQTVQETDLKTIKVAKVELSRGNYDVLRKLIASDAWDIIMHKEIISYAVEFIMQSLSNGAGNDMQIMLQSIKSAFYKYLAVYSIIYVVDIPGISLVLSSILFFSMRGEIVDAKYTPRDGVFSLRCLMFVTAWFVGFYLQGEQLAAIASFVAWFLGSSLVVWLVRGVSVFVYRKFHDFYFGFSVLSKEYNNPKILDLKYIRPTIDNLVIEYFSTLLIVYICGNPLLPPFVFKHSLLFMLLSILGLLSSYNFVHLALITLIVYVVARRGKSSQIELKIINEYVKANDEVPKIVDEINVNKFVDSENKVVILKNEIVNSENVNVNLENKNVILENENLNKGKNNLFNLTEQNFSEAAEKRDLIFTIDDYIGAQTIVKTQIMM